jgi:hypothetical protein
MAQTLGDHLLDNELDVFVIPANELTGDQPIRRGALTRTDRVGTSATTPGVPSLADAEDILTAYRAAVELQVAIAIEDAPRPVETASRRIERELPSCDRCHHNVTTQNLTCSRCRAGLG